MYNINNQETIQTLQNKKYQIKTIEEKADFSNFKMFLKWDSSTSAFHTDANFGMFFQRNLVDDTFLIGSHHYQFHGQSKLGAVDKKYAVTINNETTNVNEDISYNSEDPIIVQRHQIKNKNLVKVGSYGMTIENQDSKNSIQFTGFPAFQAPIKEFTLKEKQILEFKMINTINISLEDGDKNEIKTIPCPETSNGVVSAEGMYHSISQIGGMENNKFVVKKTYSHLYIVPTEIKTNGEHNKILYKVFIKNDEAGIRGVKSQNTSYDFRISNGKLETNKIKNYETLFDFSEKEEDNDNDELRFVGNIELFQDSYYDYENQKVVKGFSSYSKPGELIPYNFTGDYHRKLVLDVNAIYKDISISQIKHIEQPILDPDEGKIKLSITENKDELNEKDENFSQDYRIIPFEKLKAFEREHVFSLNAIKELSQEGDGDKNA